VGPNCCAPDFYQTLLPRRSLHRKRARASLSPLPVVKIGGVAAIVVFAGLVAPGEFQFNVIVPPSLADGDQPVTATYNGLSTQSGTLITVQR
jgi:uncharacterized protein (TIGR03437 family)